MNGHPQTVSVPLGSWANLNCTVNSCNSIINWIVWIESEGLNRTYVRQSENITGDEVQYTVECIGNFKTVTLDIKTSSTTVVEFQEYKYNSQKIFYSEFAIVIVESRAEDPLLH